MVQVVRFGAKICRLGPSDSQSQNGIGLSSNKKDVTEQSLVQQQYEVHTHVRVTIDALDYEYNHDARTQSLRLSTATV